MSAVGAVRDLLWGEPDAAIDATPDAVLDLLANERRRLVVHALAEADGDPVELTTLAEAIAAAECDCPPGELSGPQYKRVYVALYQTHMRQVVDAGVAEQIESGRGSDVYRATDMARVLDDLAASIEGRCTEEPRRTDPAAVAAQIAGEPGSDAEKEVSADA